MARSELVFTSALILTILVTSEAGSICPLPWNYNASLPDDIDLDKPCPYGTSPFKIFGKSLDVTVPTDATGIEKLCVFYGLIPFLVIGVAVVDTIVRGIMRPGIGSRELIFLSFVGVQVILSELVFKKIVKQARPDESCNHTCGMPSSHATMSIGFFTLMFIDAAYRVMPLYPSSVDAARNYFNHLENRHSVVSCRLSEFKVALCHAGFSTLPLSNSHTLNTWDFISYVCFWGVVLLPVPLTRNILHDHTGSQVMIGGAIGAVEAILYYTILHQVVFTRSGGWLGKTKFGIFHNYAMPLFEVISRSYWLLAEAADYEAEDINSKELGPDANALGVELSDNYHELNWYQKGFELDETNFTKQFLYDEDTGRLDYQRSILAEVIPQVQAEAQRMNAKYYESLIAKSDFSKMKLRDVEEDEGME